MYDTHFKVVTIVHCLVNILGVFTPGGTSEFETFSKRAAGIEPALIAWKAIVLPLNYAREIPTF